MSLIFEELRVLGVMNTKSAAFVRILIVGVVLFASAGARSQAIERKLPFTIPATDTALSPFLPQPSDDGIVPITVSAEGHFMAPSGERIRLFGCMLSGTTNFIPGADAKMLAKRLRKLGFNAVKLDDNDYWNYDAASFFATRNAQGQVNTSSFVINPVQLARFDTLFYYLKQNGIYIVFSLSSQHRYVNGDGLLRADSLYFHMFGPFLDAKAAELMRGWARTFLTHVNPLTGMRYADDPALAIVEYNNESSLYWYWNSLDRLVYINPQNYGAGKYTISYGYSRRLDTLYNLFLKQKYGNDNAIRTAWMGSGNISGANLMADASFENPSSPSWNFIRRNGAAADAVNYGPGIDSEIYKRILISDLGPNPALANIVLENATPRLGTDTLYEVSFWAKMGFDNTNPSKTTRAVNFRVAHFTNGSLAVNQTITIDTSWKKYTYKFRSLQGGLYRVQLLLGAERGDVWLDAFWLKQTYEAPPESGETLASYGYKRIRNDGQIRLQPLQRIRDQVMFLDTLEKSFYAPMNRLIKDTLKFKGFVNHRQNGYWATLPDIYTTLGSDVSVNHFNHDYAGSRPNQAYTDSTWMVRNNPMVALRSAGTLPYLTAGRIKGKPHVIGEYFAPYPNQHNVEQWTLVPAWGAYQDWDGLFMGFYARASGELFADSLPNFFRGGGDPYSFGNNPAVLAIAPFAAKMFRDGFVKPAEYTATLTHDPDDVWLYPAFVGGRGAYGVEGNIESNIFTQMKLDQSFNQPKHKVAAEYPYVADTAAKVSDSKELRWDEGLGRFTVTTPYLYAACGLYTTDSASFPGFSFARTDKPSKPEHLTVYLYPLDTNVIEASRDMVMAIGTRAQNSGVVWRDSLGWDKNFGTKPTVISAPQMHIEFVSELDSVFVYPIDNRGRMTETRLIASRIGETNRFYLNFDAQFRNALWYRIVSKGAPLAVGDDRSSSKSVSITVTPNPAVERATVRYRGTGKPMCSLFDALGRAILVNSAPRYVTADDIRFDFDCSVLSAGHYSVVVQDGATSYVRALRVVH